MLKNYSICALMMIASAGFTLAIFGAVTTLWPHVPTQEGRADFAFSLAIAFAAFFGNSILVGTELLISNRNSKLNKITSLFSILIFYLGLIMVSILFSEGLNDWFETVPTMSSPLILTLRVMMVLPFVWLLISLAFKLFSKKSTQ